MIDGNTAAALGCIYGGATFGAWYPITPSTSLMDGFAKYCAELRVDADTGKNKYCIIQAEDELAAAGLTMGAAWNGARAFTPTSGPGISLMSEFIGFAYYSEVPMVLFDIQRCGPSTGMPTRTQQCDIQLCAYASHGDTRHICLYPADPGECFEMSAQALDLADRFSTPVFVLSDIDIGMNDWMTDELTWDENYVPDRGKLLSSEDVDKLDAFYRFTDEDGSGLPKRTLPGTNPKGAYFLRGSGHDKYGRYTESGPAYKEVVDRLVRKWKSAAEYVPTPILRTAASKTPYGILSIGSCDGAVMEARDRMAENGLRMDYMRVRGFPFHQDIEDFIAAHETVFVVEQNRDAQLLGLLLLETNTPREKLHSVVHYSGEPLDYRFVLSQISNVAAEMKSNKKIA